MATPFEIADSDLSSLKEKVVIVTGGSSGIGLATVQLLLSLGANVVIGDRNPAPEDLLSSSKDVTYVSLDVTDWKSVSALFKKTIELHGGVDHVFANAGISTTETYLEDKFDDDGELLPPSNLTVNINLIGVIYTVKLAVHYIRKQERGGSIVMTASASSFQRFEAVDYTTAKHGVLGLMRGLVPLLHNYPSRLAHLQSTGPAPAVRINSLAPNWTASGIVPRAALEAAGVPVQSPSVVARSAAICMADEQRHGQLIFSNMGKYTEIEGALMQAKDEFLRVGGERMNLDDGMQSLDLERLKRSGEKA